MFAPLTEFLIDTYGWRGALLIIGGLMLNITVCGTVFRPLVSPKLERRRRRYQASMERFSKMCSRQQLNHQPMNKSEMDNLMNAPVTQSVMQFPTYLQQEITVLYPSLLEKENKDKTLHEVLAENNLLDKFSQSLTDIPQQQENASKTTANGSHPLNPVWKTKLANKKPLPPTSSYNQPLQRKDIFYRGSLAKGPVKASASCPNIHVHYEEEEDDDWWTNWFKFSRGVKHILREMMDISILRSVIFMYLCLSTFLLYFSYDVPYVFTPDKAVQMGISEEKASFLVSIIGITSTVGQILIGYHRRSPRCECYCVVFSPDRHWWASDNVSPLV